MSSDTRMWYSLLDGDLLLARDGRGALAEAVLETAAHVLLVLHAALALGLPPLGLLGPVVDPDLRRWVAALGAGLLLVVVRALAAARAEAVGLLVALALARSTVTHGSQQKDTNGVMMWWWLR